MCDKHPAKKYNIPWVHKPADTMICMHCLSLVKLLCYTDLPQKEELLGRCLLKVPCSPSEQPTVRNWSYYIFLWEKLWCRGVSPSTWGRAESLCREEIRPMRSVDKVKALLSTLQSQDAFCLLSLHPQNTLYGLYSDSTQQKKQQFPQVFIAFIIKRHHYFLPAELPW